MVPVGVPLTCPLLIASGEGELSGLVRAVGIEGADFTIGEGLSEQVDRTATTVTTELAGELVATAFPGLSGQPAVPFEL